MAIDKNKELKNSFSQISMLKKGDEVNLETLDPTLKNVVVGVGWDAPAEEGGFPVDIDASAFILSQQNRVRYDMDFVFYNNLSTEGGAVLHTGDNTTGDGDGDDETIEIKLDHMAFDVDRIAFAVTLHNAAERRHTFGLIKNAYIRIVNKDTGVELAHFDLTEDASEDNAMIFGELVRQGASWIFKAIGAGSKGGLYQIARDFGVNVAPV
jgi:tellurium resistance protein TerD